MDRAKAQRRQPPGDASPRARRAAAGAVCPRRCATRRPAGSSRSRRHANARTAAEAESSHWTSSTASEQRTIGGVLAKRAENGDGDRPLIGGCSTRPLEQECDPKRVSLGRRERVEQLIQPVAKQIAEACEGEPRLGLRRVESRGLDSRSPEPRLRLRCQSVVLPTPASPTRTNAAGPLLRVEKVVQRVEFFLTADNVGVGRGRHLPGAC